MQSKSESNIFVQFLAPIFEHFLNSQFFSMIFLLRFIKTTENLLEFVLCNFSVLSMILQRRINKEREGKKLQSINQLIDTRILF